MTFAQDPTTASPLTIKTNDNPSTDIEDVVMNIKQVTIVFFIQMDKCVSLIIGPLRFIFSNDIK